MTAPSNQEPEIRVVASGLLFPEGPVVQEDGSVMIVEIQRETVSRVNPDGSVDVVAQPGGGPNGLAVGPDGAVYICNNGGFLFQTIAGYTRTRAGVHKDYTSGRIERLDVVTGALTTLYDRCGEHPLCGPNDIVFDRHGGFYFTDFGKNRARDRDHGGLYYALADGSRIVEVAYPMVTPNGVGLSPDGAVVYVSETETGRLWAFDLAEPGRAVRHPFPSPHGGRLVCGLPGYQRFDSMAVDAHGNVCVATLISGCITVVSPNGQLLRQVPLPDPVATNIAFGGPDRKTAYITLSGTGCLVAMDWPDPGLRLVYCR
ncbi:SMP-30/gluconolactonase/LRE family protein [Azospirillum canadense]|uniref:SMP-30/gluconolactonase/LRE family protein n=1 Tax=Azospirillum canadense TaxID=403962 RepID=UPI002227A759|nr:SMP-30/gluconolactonase/LRE family protein [Azospirillum canadense]MCW2241418.1 gluconolactonase [Azospirillum canadense]